MKVYTHYIEENGEGFRWRTLLQFGKSWNVIGSVVMKNPGTASPKEKVMDENCLAHLLMFDAVYNEWFEFKADSTMNCVGDLFAYYYDKKNRDELDGVIQIFNLFYLRDSNLEKAIEKNKIVKCPFHLEEQIIEEDISHLVAPIYLGFGDLAFKKEYKARAERFLAAAKKDGMAYLDDELNKNKYFHPQYLMRFGKNSSESINIRLQFKENRR